jgi:ankyrin repeat protein
VIARVTIVLALLCALGGLANARAKLPATATDAAPLLRAGDRAGLEKMLDDGLSANASDATHAPLLIDAARLGQVELVELLLDHGAPIDVTAAGDTPLIVAADAGQTDVVRLLLARGARIDVQGPNGTALRVAMRRDYVDTGALLVDAGTSDDARQELEYAISDRDLAAARMLLAHHAPLSSASSSLEPLAVAAMRGDLAMVDLLIAAHADVDEQDFYRGTPLMIAAAQGSVTMTKHLIAAGAKIGATNHDGYQAIHDATTPEILKLLLDAGADPEAAIASTGATPLVIAAGTGHVDVVRALLAKHVHTDSGQQPALHTAIVQGEGALMVPILLAAGANPKLIDQTNGESPLHLAVKYRSLAAITALLDAGVSPDLPDKIGMTPIMLADRTAVADLLLARGAKLDSHDAKGHGALFTAAQRGDAEMVVWLLAHGADAHAADHDGVTPLHLTANGRIVRLLVAAGADPNARDAAGRTPADVAGQDPWVLRELLLANADVELVDHDGHTPLHYAARSGSRRAVEMLLAAGADPGAVGKDKKTPLDLATDEPVKQLLRNAKAKPAAAKKQAPTKKQPAPAPKK